MKTTRNLTNVFDDHIEDLIARSAEGMAHWSGTGPDDRTCRQCAHYRSPGYYSANNSVQGNQMKPGYCMRFKLMMGKKGPSFRPTMESCRFFHENPDAPPLVTK